MKKFFVYILECSDKNRTLYTGQTARLTERILEHMRGDGGRYTRGRLPVVLVHAETYPTRGEAMKRERQIKKMTRKQKERLIRDGPN